MNGQLCLFSVDLDEPEIHQESERHPIPAMVTAGRRSSLKDRLRGRCVRCGSHVLEKPGMCLECMGSEVCACGDCLSIASIHRMLQDDLYWLRRNVLQGEEAEWERMGIAPKRWPVFMRTRLDQLVGERRAAAIKAEKWRLRASKCGVMS